MAPAAASIAAGADAAGPAAAAHQPPPPATPGRALPARSPFEPTFTVDVGERHNSVGTAFSIREEDFESLEAKAAEGRPMGKGPYLGQKEKFTVPS